jgi:hypothetical protein
MIANSPMDIAPITIEFGCGNTKPGPMAVRGEISTPKRMLFATVGIIDRGLSGERNNARESL